MKAISNFKNIAKNTFTKNANRRKAMDIKKSGLSAIHAMTLIINSFLILG